MMIIGRVIAGLGASGLANGAITIIAIAITPEKRPCKTQTETVFLLLADLS